MGGLEPLNLARGQAGRRSWAAEFALAQRCGEAEAALANPHSWQRVALPLKEFPELDHLPLQKILPSEAPRRTYRQRLEEAKSTVHWGQRKLFMAELEFLLDFADEAQHVIYAGAAEGQHLAFLCELFPEIQLDAWDPRPFAPSALPPEAPANLRVHQEFFTDQVVRRLRAKAPERPVLFVSDIRTANWQRDSAEEHDQRLLEDLEAQQRWVGLLRPVRALLKFRFPYSAGRTEGLAGEMRLPVWGPQTTTECRLLVTPPESREMPLSTKLYDHQCMWEQLFYFNTVTRISIYPRPSFVLEADEEMLRTAGLCRCYDCSREVDLLATYLVRKTPDSQLVKAIVELVRDVSLGCGRGPSGLLDAPTAPWQAQSEQVRVEMFSRRMSTQEERLQSCSERAEKSVALPQLRSLCREELQKKLSEEDLLGTPLLVRKQQDGLNEVQLQLQRLQDRLQLAGLRQAVLS